MATSAGYFTVLLAFAHTLNARVQPHQRGVKTMTTYEDFLLNELVGTFGLDFEQTAEVLHQIDELRDQNAAEDAATC
jgi:hypothetical protein